MSFTLLSWEEMKGHRCAVCGTAFVKYVRKHESNSRIVFTYYCNRCVLSVQGEEK